MYIAGGNKEFGVVELAWGAQRSSTPASGGPEQPKDFICICSEGLTIGKTRVVRVRCPV